MANFLTCFLHCDEKKNWLIDLNWKEVDCHCSSDNSLDGVSVQCQFRIRLENLDLEHLLTMEVEHLLVHL